MHGETDKISVIAEVERWCEILELIYLNALKTCLPPNRHCL
jgi:hypothetical protein